MPPRRTGVHGGSESTTTFHAVVRRCQRKYRMRSVKRPDVQRLPRLKPLHQHKRLAPPAWPGRA